MCTFSASTAVGLSVNQSCRLSTVTCPVRSASNMSTVVWYHFGFNKWRNRHLPINTCSSWVNTLPVCVFNTSRAEKECFFCCVPDIVEAKMSTTLCNASRSSLLDSSGCIVFLFNWFSSCFSCLALFFSFKKLASREYVDQCRRVVFFVRRSSFFRRSKS